MLFRDFWNFIQLDQDATLLTTGSSDQLSHSVHDALRNYILPGIKASPDFYSSVLLSSLTPHPSTYPVLPVNPLHSPVRP
jgi:hypothetical protein